MKKIYSVSALALFLSPTLAVGDDQVDSGLILDQMDWGSPQWHHEDPPFDPDEVFLGDPVVGGTGCPQGTVQTALGFDGTTVSILFDAYYAETQEGDTFSHRSCDVAVPVHIPNGITVALMQVDYRGFAMVPHGGTAQFSAEYFFAGLRGPVRRRSFAPGFFDNYLIEHQVPAATIVWSACGEDVILRANTSAVARKNSSTPVGEETFLSVDSADVVAGVEFRLVWDYCD